MLIIVSINKKHVNHCYLYNIQVFKSVQILCKFNVSFLQILIILNHNKKFNFYIFLVFLYYKLYFFLVQRIDYISIIRDKELLKF